MSRDPFPTFYLYGEPHRHVEEDFVHLESLDNRSRPSNWHIDAHRHTDLCHIFVAWSGGGSMSVDAQTVHFTAPCLLLIPVATLHSFDWDEDTIGSVITMSDRYMAGLFRSDPLPKMLFDRARAVALDPLHQDRARTLFDDLRQELGWSAAGHRAAVDATIISMLVLAARSSVLGELDAPKPGRHALLVARLRQRIEERFRLREPIARHIEALGTSETALREACAKVAGSSPAKLLDHRALLEARRALLYTNLSIAEVGFSIGFGDPAYFSRFFKRHIGVSPAQFRETGGDRPPDIVATHSQLLQLADHDL